MPLQRWIQLTSLKGHGLGGPDPLSGSGVGEDDFEIEASLSFGRDLDLGHQNRVGRGGGVKFEADFPCTCGVGGVLNEGLGPHAITLVGKCGRRGLKHQGFVDESLPDAGSEALPTFVRHCNEPVAGKGVGSFEAGGEGSVLAGEKGGHPGGGRRKVGARLEFFSASKGITISSSDKEAFVTKKAVFEGFRDEIPERGAVENPQGTGLVEVGKRAWVGVSHDGQCSLIDGIEGNLGGRDRLVSMIDHLPRNGDQFAGAGFTSASVEIDGEAGGGRLDGEIAVTEAQLRFGTLALGVSGSLDDEN